MMGYHHITPPGAFCSQGRPLKAISVPHRWLLGGVSSGISLPGWLPRHEASGGAAEHSGGLVRKSGWESIVDQNEGPPGAPHQSDQTQII